MFDSSFFVALSFLIFVGLVIYMGLPKMIISVLDKRSEGIQEELDEARNLREEAQKLLAKEKKNLDRASEESKNLIKIAKQQVDEMRKKAEENLKEDIERKKKIAELKIEQAQTEALNDVKARIANLSFQITKNYLSKNLDKKVSKSILDDSISEIKKNL